MDSDEALFRKLARGDMTAFDALYDRYERPILGFVRAQLGDAAEAEDVCHDAFMAVLRERAKGDDVRSFRAWLFEVARHLCLNRVRSRKRAVRAVQTETHAQAMAQAPETAAEELERRERLSRLEGAITRLPPALAEVYRLRATGMPYDEVATILEVPLGTVKSRMHDMIERLKNEAAE